MSVEWLPPTFWTAIDIDYKTNISEPGIKSLVDLSSEKIISNVYVLNHTTHQIPVFLHDFLLQKALANNRVLSIIHLLKCYPRECFCFLTPSDLNNWSLFSKQHIMLQSFKRFFIKQSEAVILTFFTVIMDSTNSQLKILDMNEVPIETSILVHYLDGLSLLKNPPQTPYILKTKLIVAQEEDLSVIFGAKMLSCIAAYLKIKVTGLHIYRCMPHYRTISKLFQLLQEDELQVFSLDLCRSMYNNIFPSLTKFHCLQSLSLTYVDGFTSDENFLTSFSKTLNSFQNLKHLCLRGSCLSNRLQTLMKHDCSTSFLDTDGTPQNCCILHRGKLEYLDLAYCRLQDNDVKCLMEFSSTKSLKYLNLCGNKLKSYVLMETIKKLEYSLVVLDIEDCFLPDTSLHGFISSLASLKKLKSISMKSLPLKFTDLEVLSTTARRMPELRQIYLNRLDFDYCNNYKKIMSERKIDIFWYPEGFKNNLEESGFMSEVD